MKNTQAVEAAVQQLSELFFACTNASHECGAADCDTGDYRALLKKSNAAKDRFFAALRAELSKELAAPVTELDVDRAIAASGMQLPIPASRLHYRRALESFAASRVPVAAGVGNWVPIKLSDAPNGLTEIYPESQTYQFLAPRGDGSVAGNEAWIFTVPPLPVRNQDSDDLAVAGTKGVIPRRINFLCQSLTKEQAGELTARICADLAERKANVSIGIVGLATPPQPSALGGGEVTEAQIDEHIRKCGYLDTEENRADIRRELLGLREAIPAAGESKDAAAQLRKAMGISQDFSDWSYEKLMLAAANRLALATKSPKEDRANFRHYLSGAMLVALGDYEERPGYTKRDHIAKKVLEAFDRWFELLDAQPPKDAAPVAVGIGSIVRFGGETFKVVCNGDIPGTFDLHVHPRGRGGDQWRNVPASRLILDATPAGVQPCLVAVAWLVDGGLTLREDWADRLHHSRHRDGTVDAGRAIPQSWKPVLFTVPAAEQTNKESCSMPFGEMPAFPSIRPADSSGRVG